MGSGKTSLRLAQADYKNAEDRIRTCVSTKLIGVFKSSMTAHNDLPKPIPFGHSGTSAKRINGTLNRVHCRFKKICTKKIEI